MIKLKLFSHPHDNHKQNETYKNKNSVVSSHINTRNESFRSVGNTLKV